MRTILPKALLLTSFALTLWGCATFDGVIVPLHQETISKAGETETAAVSRARIEVFFEKPEVVDQDEDRDFTPLAEIFAESLRQVSADYFCSRGVFARCKTVKHEGAYRLKTKVVIGNYRQAHGGLAMAVVGGFFPPLLGIGWSVPAFTGSCTLNIDWILEDPAGQEIWKRSEVLADSIGGCMDGENVAYHLKLAIEKSITNLSLAALATEQEAVRARELLAKKPVEAKISAAVREVVAVFDVQDASNRFKEDLLLQLTSYLSTTMVASGRFTVVPREQLRARLADEKFQSYKVCYDDACQIELGKAVAAQKSLATQLLHVGEKCVVVANLIDLKTETSVSGAKVHTDCDVDKLLAAMDEVVKQIAQ